MHGIAQPLGLQRLESQNHFFPCPTNQTQLTTYSNYKMDDCWVMPNTVIRAVNPSSFSMACPARDGNATPIIRSLPNLVLASLPSTGPVSAYPTFSTAASCWIGPLM